MHQEYLSLHHNQTWTLVLCTFFVNILNCRWVYKTKTWIDSSLERRKACLVAKEYQQYGLDYTETFSHVVKPTIVCMIVSLVVTHAWPLRQLDIQNAFLHGSLADDVYMQQS